MGKKYIQVPVEDFMFSDSYMELWLDGRKVPLHLWTVNELTKPLESQRKCIAVVGNRGIGKSSLARIMTKQIKDIFVLETQLYTSIPLDLRDSLWSVIELKTIKRNERNKWKDYENDQV